jgi:hypothetical protein
LSVDCDLVVGVLVNFFACAALAVWAYRPKNISKVKQNDTNKVWAEMGLATFIMAILRFVLSKTASTDRHHMLRTRLAPR